MQRNFNAHSAYTYRKLTIANRRLNCELKKNTHANVRAGCIALFAVACLKSMSLKWTFLSQFLFYDYTNVGNGGATNCRHFYHFSLVLRTEIHLFSMQQSQGMRNTHHTILRSKLPNLGVLLTSTEESRKCLPSMIQIFSNASCLF